MDAEDQSTRINPAREFTNQQSLEEAQDIWRDRADRMISAGPRRMTFASFWVGVMILMIWLALSVGSFELTVNGVRRSTEALYLLFSVGCFLLAAPLVFLAWAATKLPAWPTKETHEQRAQMMRIGQRITVSDGERATRSPG